MQPDLGGPLDTAELGRMKAFLDAAAERGIKVVIDLHNFGRYDGDVLGSKDLPASAFADFWGKLATALDGNPGLGGYGLMNEPHDMGTAAAWPDSAQAAINAIRLVDAATEIYVAGDSWSSAARWQTANPGFPLSDPAGKIVYEAHLYFDTDQSGRYEGSYDAQGGYADLGADRVQPFLDWLAANNAKGFVGEFGVPDDDPRWLEVMDRFLKAIDDAGVSGTYWAAGPWWGDYKLSVEPINGHDRPQMDVLEKYAGDDDTITVIDQLPVNTVPGAQTVFEDIGAIIAGLSIADPDSAALTTKLTVQHGTLSVGVDLLGASVAGNGGQTLTLTGTADSINKSLAGLTYLGLHDFYGSDTIGFFTSDGASTATSSLAVTVTPVDDLPAGLTLVGGSGRDILTGAAGADLLSGGANNDKLYGMAENDRLNGEDGNDLLDGGTGDDILTGGKGADTLVGGAGVDTASYASASAGVTADLTSPKGNKGDAAGDTYSGVENLTGSGFADVLKGDKYANVLDGGAGNDALTGGAGNDTLIGGGGTDAAVFSGKSRDYRWTTNSDGSWTVTDLRAKSPDGTDQLVSVETLRFTDKSVSLPAAVQKAQAAASPAASAEPGSSTDRFDFASLLGSARHEHGGKGLDLPWGDLDQVLSHLDVGLKLDAVYEAIQAWQSDSGQHIWHHDMLL